MVSPARSMSRGCVEKYLLMSSSAATDPSDSLAFRYILVQIFELDLNAEHQVRKKIEGKGKNNFFQTNKRENKDI